MAVTQAEVAKLYVATFNRAPDAGGLSYWTNTGMSIENIAQSFFDQSETQTLYPSGTTNSSFVTSVYANLFNRAPDTDGLNYWVQELDNGNITKQNFILAVINGAQNTAVSQDATILTNKQTVGMYFSGQGLNDVAKATQVMTDIDDSDASVLSAYTLVDNHASETISSFIDGKAFTVQSTSENDIQSTYYILNDHMAFELATEGPDQDIVINTYTVNGNTVTMTNLLYSDDSVSFVFPDNHLDVGDSGAVIADSNDNFIVTRVNDDASSIIEARPTTSNSISYENMEQYYYRGEMFDEPYWTEVIFSPNTSEVIAYQDQNDQLFIYGVNTVVSYQLDM